MSRIPGLKVRMIGRVLASRDTQIRIAVVLIVFGLVVAALVFRGRIPYVNSIGHAIGYPAVFLISLFGSSSFVVPVPSMAAVCAGGIFLAPVVVALLAGLAEALGELSGYGLGFSGRSIMRRGRIYDLAYEWMQKRGTLVLFLASVIPNPIFKVIGVSAGGLHFPITRFFLVVLVGKTIKSLGVVYVCSFTLRATGA